MIKTADRDEKAVGAFEVHTGSIGYWSVQDDARKTHLQDSVRQKRLRELKFSKSTPIFTIPAEHFGIFLGRAYNAGLEKLPRQAGSVPPKKEAYYMLQIAQDQPRIFLKPNAKELSSKVHAGELTRQTAQNIADSWSRVKTEVYNFTQYSVGVSTKKQ